MWRFQVDSSTFTPVLIQGQTAIVGGDFISPFTIVIPPSSGLLLTGTDAGARLLLSGTPQETNVDLLSLQG